MRVDRRPVSHVLHAAGVAGDRVILDEADVDDGRRLGERLAFQDSFRFARASIFARVTLVVQFKPKPSQQNDATTLP